IISVTRTKQKRAFGFLISSFKVFLVRIYGAGEVAFEVVRLCHKHRDIPTIGEVASATYQLGILDEFVILLLPVVYVGDEIGHYRGIGSVGFGATQIFQGLVVFAVRILHIAGVVTCPWRVRTVLSLDKIELFKGFIEFFLVEQAVSPGKPTLILLVGC